MTSASFADRYVQNGEVVTHSHGPQGMHSHGLIDFNTWMDPTQAALQAEAIHDELVRSASRCGEGFRCKFEALQKDLADIESAPTRVRAARQRTALGLASGLSLHRPPLRLEIRRTVHWEPDEMPSDANGRN